MASDGAALRVYQAVLDARALLSELNYGAKPTRVCPPLCALFLSSPQWKWMSEGLRGLGLVVGLGLGGLRL